MLRRLAVLVVPPLLALPLLAGPPAHADAITVGDSRADVWETVYGDDGEVLARHRRPGRTHEDVRSVRIDRRAHHLVLRTTVADRVPRYRGFTVVRHTVRTDDGRQFLLDASPDRPRVTAVDVYEIHPGGGAEFHPCPDAESVTSGDSWTFSVPRRCLGRPAWVRVSSRVSSETINAEYFGDWRGTRGRGVGPLSRRVPADPLPAR